MSLRWPLGFGTTVIRYCSESVVPVSAAAGIPAAERPLTMNHDGIGRDFHIDLAASTIFVTMINNVIGTITTAGSSSSSSS